MNEHLKEIRSGFLRQVGAVPLLVLLSILTTRIATGTGLSLSASTIAAIRWSLAAGGILLLCFGMWRYHRRRIQILEQEISYLRSGLLIHSARYGAGDVTTDVAPYLQRQIAMGRRNIPVGNSLLDGGEDPCKNVKKVGRVEYSRQGRHETQEVIEDAGDFNFDT